MDAHIRQGKLSIIFLSYQSSDVMEERVAQIFEHMKEEAIPIEVIIMDDGSNDNSYAIAQKIEQENPHVFAYQLSKNYTTNYSKFAGLEVCNGDCAVFVPDDFQRSLQTVTRMYRKWQTGEQIVIDYRDERNDGWVTDKLADTYYMIMNKYSDVDFPKGGSDGALLDREIIDILNNRINPINTSLMVEILRLGFQPFMLPSKRIKTGGKSRWTRKKKMRLAMDTFFNASSFPIKLIGMIGWTIFFLSIIFIIIIILARLFGDTSLFGFPIPGWTTTLVIMAFFNSIVILSLAVISEYIWRIFEEVKNRPPYIIKKKEN